MSPPFYEQLLALDGPLIQGFLVLFFALLLARLAPLPQAFQPLAWLSHLAKSLAAKVKRGDRDERQQLIAGSLAILLLVLPFWLIITFLLELAAFPWFFEFLILYLCLNDACFIQEAEEIYQALRRGDKPAARELLSPWVARDTAELSEAGIAKATIEKLVTTPIHGTVTVVSFFCLAGAPMVLLVRMLKQLEQSWWCLDPQYRFFGRPVFLVNQVLLYIPAQLWRFTLAIQGGPQALKLLWQTPHSRFPIGFNFQVATMAAYVLMTELGGPQKYSGIKVQVEKVGPGPVPDHKTIPKAISLTFRTFAIWFAFVVLLPLIWVLLRYSQTL